MTKAAELAKMGEVLTNGQIGGRRNMIINGSQIIAQRGEKTGCTVSQYTTCDRFKLELSSAGTWTTSQSTTTPDGFAKSLKLDCTTADGSLDAGNYILISHYLEGQDLQHLKKGTSGAEKVTLSFHVRSNKTGTYIVEFYDSDNSRSISKSYTIDSANTFEKKTITIDGDTSGAFGNDTGGSLGIFFYLGAGSNFTSGTLNTSWNSRTLANVAVGQVNLADSTDNEWLITGVQLEVSEKETPFEYRSFGEEMALCLRYFYRIGGSFNGNAQSPITNSMAYSANETYGGLRLPVRMRATPSISYSAYPNLYRGGSSIASTSFSIDSSNSSSQDLRIRGDKSSGFTTGDGSWMQIPSSGATCDFDSEL